MARRFFYDTEFIENHDSINLISIGVVGDDGSGFYACNADCDLSKANDWVKENVICHLPPMGEADGVWLSHCEIKRKLFDYLKPDKDDPVELWGYYSAYDHVVICWLFGKMIDLPPGMPMYTRDLKQLMDMLSVKKKDLPVQDGDLHDALEDARWNKKVFDFLRSVAWNRESMGNLFLDL